MKKVFLYIAIVLGVACNKQTAAKPEPVIVINTPSANQHFVNGDIINIKGNITHSINLTEAGVHMIDVTSKDEVFHNHFSAGNKPYFEFDSRYTVPDNKKTSFIVEVEATDKNGTVTTKKITITIN